MVTELDEISIHLRQSHTVKMVKRKVAAMEKLEADLYVPVVVLYPLKKLIPSGPVCNIRSGGTPSVLFSILELSKSPMLT